MRLGLVTAVVLAGVAVPAAAQSPGYAQCMARANGTVQRGVCAQTELGAQDARLNKAYQQLMRQLTPQPGRKLALRTAQRSWLARRDYDCKIDGITIDSTCVIEKTAARADALEAQLRF